MPRGCTPERQWHKGGRTPAPRGAARHWSTTRSQLSVGGLFHPGPPYTASRRAPPLPVAAADTSAHPGRHHCPRGPETCQGAAMPGTQVQPPSCHRGPRSTSRSVARDPQCQWPPNFGRGWSLASATPICVLGVHRNVSTLFWPAKDRAGLGASLKSCRR